jgi:hypothetical protein
MNKATGRKILLAWFNKMENFLECNQPARKAFNEQLARA